MQRREPIVVDVPDPFRPVVGRTVGLDGVADALEAHAARRTTGRTVADLRLGRTEER